MDVFDLHCHTHHSDGNHSVDEVIQLAQSNGVTVLSITDHDTLDAYYALKHVDCRMGRSFKFYGMKLIPGIEFSTYWNKTGIHIVGLNVDLTCSALESAVSEQQAKRQLRAETIAEKLAQLGVENPLQGAKDLTHKGGLSRVHFADYLVQQGYVKDRKQAFKRYLGAGKPGDVVSLWADMAQVIEWIKGAGGVAVLAHPRKYQLTHTKLVRLIDHFVTLGGEAIEVLSGQQNKNDIAALAKLAENKKLYSSLGSDFHSTEHSWVRLGMHTRLPKACRPVWDLF